MNPVILNLDKKVHGIGSIKIKNGVPPGFGMNADELNSADYLQGEIDIEKLLSDKVKMLEEELQRTREESFQAGYQEGKEQGLQEAKKQINEFKSLIKSFEREYANSIVKMELPLLHLAKKMAEKVIGIDLDSSAELDSILMERLKRLLYEVIDQVKVIVIVNPVHLEWLESPGIETEFNVPKTMEISFIGDENLSPGECVINTEEYHIEETYKSKLERLEQNLASKED